MRDQPVAVDEEFVALGFAAEDRMVVEHQTSLARAGLPLKNQSRGQTADAAADHHAVVGFAGVDHAGGKAFKPAIANFVAGVQYRERVAVGICVVADAAVASPVVFIRAFRCARRQQIGR